MRNMTKLYDEIDTKPKLCYRCLHYGVPKLKKGKKQWKGHIFVICANCSSHVFFG